MTVEQLAAKADQALAARGARSWDRPKPQAGYLYRIRRRKTGIAVYVHWCAGYERPAHALALWAYILRVNGLGVTRRGEHLWLTAS